MDTCIYFLMIPHLTSFTVSWLTTSQNHILLDIFFSAIHELEAISFAFHDSKICSLPLLHFVFEAGYDRIGKGLR